MIGLSSRPYGRAVLVTVLCVSLAIAGCATTGVPEANLTSEQQQLRAQKERWNETMISGAAVGAGVGAAGGVVLINSGVKEAVVVGVAAVLVGAIVGGAIGALVADRNLEFEKRKMSAEARLAAAQKATQNLEARAAISEALVQSDRAKLDHLDAQFRDNQITAAQYRTEAVSIKSDLALIKDSAEDAKKARDKINTFVAHVPQMRAEEPKMGAAQRRLEESANQIEEKFNRIP
jgi:hypothetical protein